MATVDARWQAMSKARRAAVCRAIGRASRIAREDRDSELAADIRTVMDVLRAHAKKRAAPKRAAKRKRK